MQQTEDKPKRGYWYQYEHHECVLCGKEITYKWRVYDEPKPESGQDRHRFAQYACGKHFI